MNKLRVFFRPSHVHENVIALGRLEQFEKCPQAHCLLKGGNTTRIMPRTA